MDSELEPRCTSLAYLRTSNPMAAITTVVSAMCVAPTTEPDPNGAFDIRHSISSSKTYYRHLVETCRLRANEAHAFDDEPSLATQQLDCRCTEGASGLLA